MKASSKYGSAYPGTAPGTPARGGHRLKTGKGPEATPLKMPNERDEAIDPAGGGRAQRHRGPSGQGREARPA
jgi:hypothetical protein